jgi:hypothetical protein
MKYHILLGILLWMAAAAFPSPKPQSQNPASAQDGAQSPPVLREAPSSQRKSENAAAPVMQPEFGEEDEFQEEIQNDSDEDEEGPDCDGCLLACGTLSGTLSEGVS